MDKACKSILTRLVSLKDREALVVWFTVKDNSFQLLGVQSNSANVAKLLDSAWCAEEHINNGAIDSYSQVILLLFQSYVSGEELVKANLNLIRLDVLSLPRLLRDLLCLGELIFIA